MPIDLGTATMAELQAEFLRLAQVVTEASNQRRQIHEVMKRRQASAAVKARVLALAPEEREDLKAALIEVSDNAILNVIK